MPAPPPGSSYERPSIPPGMWWSGFGMIFGFRREEVFIPESQAEQKPVEWFADAAYAARLEDSDREKIVGFITREGLTSEQGKRFLVEFESNHRLDPLAQLHFVKEVRKDWIEILKEWLQDYDIRALIRTPGGRKTILAVLQERGQFTPAQLKNIEATLHKSPRKVQKILNAPRKRGRPRDAIEQTLLNSFLACLAASWRQTFHEDPSSGCDAPAILIATHCLDQVHALSPHRTSSLLTKKTTTSCDC